MHRHFPSLHPHDDCESRCRWKPVEAQSVQDMENDYKPIQSQAWTSSCQGVAGPSFLFPLGFPGSPAPDADVLCLLFGRRVAMVNTWQERGGGEPNHKGAVSQLLTGSEVEAFSSLTPHSEVLFP